MPPVKEVNDEEPLFPAIPFANIRPTYPDQVSRVFIIVTYEFIILFLRVGTLFKHLT